MKTRLWFPIYLALGFSLLLSAGQSMAASQLVSHLSLFYFSENQERSVQAGPSDFLLKTKEVNTFMSLGLCYNLDPVCIGLKYTQNDRENTRGGTSGNVTVKTLTRYKGPGLTLGYASDSIFAQGVYYFGASKEIDSFDVTVYGGAGSTAVSYPVKSGYSLELGYGFKVGSVRIGPLLSLTAFTFSKISFDGQTVNLPADEKDEFILPQLALWFDL